MLMKMANAMQIMRATVNLKQPHKLLLNYQGDRMGLIQLRREQKIKDSQININSKMMAQG